MRTLKIYYELRDEDDILPEMEIEIKNVANKYGYTWRGQGTNIIDGVRDVCFEIPEKIDNQSFKRSG